MSGYTWKGKKPEKRNPLLDAHEQRVTAAPDHYVVSRFRGAGKFDIVACPDLEYARHMAEKMVVGSYRPVGIYAVQLTAHLSRQVLVELVEPKKGPQHGPMDR